MADLQKVRDLVKVYNDKKAELMAEIGREVPSLFADIFERYPQLESFSWTQYTPYFNDGDACEFGVNSDAETIGVNDFGGYDIDPEEEPELAKVQEEVSEVLSAVPDEVLENLYGDHVRVKVHRGGNVTKSRYSHD